MTRLILQLAELKKHEKIITPGAMAVEVAHRQWGKDTVGMHFIACAAHMRIGNYWHMLPKGEQCRTAIWESINPDTGKLRIDEAFPPVIRSRALETDMKIDFKSGASYRLVGSDNFHRLVGAMPIGILASEWARSDPMAMAYLDPMLEKNGGWMAFISTSFGHNHFETLYNFAKTEPGWYAGMHKAAATGVFQLERLERIQRKYIAAFGPDLGLSLFLQEYECSFEGAVLGSYYSQQMQQARKEGRITKVPWQPGSEVDTFWDLGVDDSMSLWFVQHIGKAHHVIDYLEDTGKGLEYFANKMCDGHRKGYKYGNHYMPHDAAEREMTNGPIAKTRQEVAENLGIGPVVIVQRAKNMDIIIQVHIPAVRNLLPSCWFDEEKCSRGVSGLESYRADYNEKTKVRSNRPAHTWESHPADAFRTMAVGYAPPAPKDKSVTEMMAERANILTG